MNEAAMATFSHIPSHLQPLAGTRSQDGFFAFSDPRKSSDWKIIGDSAAMKRLRLQIRRIGPHFRAMLIQGEGGTGKELVARAMHQAGMRADGPFVVAACGNRISYLMKVARGGTLFFNGIDDVPLATQDELVEVLRRNEWAQDGLAAPQRLSSGMIASAKRDLKGLVASGQFRQELHHRIAMVQIAVPPLRERMDDVPALAMHFLDRLRNTYQKKAVLADDAMELLKSHCWPGNVRELKNVLENAVIRCESGAIQARDLDLASATSSAEEAAAFIGCEAGTTRLQHVVDQHVLRVLRDCAGNKLRAAELLGISRSTLYRMLESCASGISAPGGD
jgi:DNA-binding NtrC family response regulator